MVLPSCRPFNDGILEFEVFVVPVLPFDACELVIVLGVDDEGVPLGTNLRLDLRDQPIRPSISHLIRGHKLSFTTVPIPTGRPPVRTSFSFATFAFTRFTIDMIPSTSIWAPCAIAPARRGSS